MYELLFSLLCQDTRQKDGVALAPGVTVRYLVEGKAWRQKPEAAGYVGDTVRKQREMNAGARLTFSFSFSDTNIQGRSPLLS